MASDINQTKHKIVLGSPNFPDSQKISNLDCDGELYYDEVCEGNFCNKCGYYDGVK